MTAKGVGGGEQGEEMVGEEAGGDGVGMELLRGGQRLEVGGAAAQQRLAFGRGEEVV